MHKRYGLVVRINDQCWLGEYQGDSVTELSPFLDQEGVYSDLNPKEISLVEIESIGIIDNEDEEVTLKDLKVITVKNHETNKEQSIEDLINEGHLPEISKCIYEEELEL